MTYPEDVLKAAREAAIAALWRPSDEAQRRNIRNGYGDHYSEVQAACIAIMAERQRCAGIAAEHEGYAEATLPEWEPDSKSRWQAVGFANAAKAIKRAILAQREGA